MLGEKCRFHSFQKKSGGDKTVRVEEGAGKRKGLRAEIVEDGEERA